MLSFPDFKQKQILIINTLEQEGKCSLKFQNENIVFLKDDKVVNRASCHKIFAVMVIGDLTITTKLIENANDLGVSFFLLKRNFQHYASLQSIAEGNYLLRAKQYGLTHFEELEIAKKIVANKISNQLLLIRGKLRPVEYEDLQKDLIAKIKSCVDGNSLLGIEGNISKFFYSKYFLELEWLRRTPRTKEDIPNLLLDIGYTFLFNFIDSLLLLYGFDTYKGVYHKLFFQRKSLSCDIMEPFRCIIDKALLKAYHLGQIDEKDFEYYDGKMRLGYKSSSKYTRIFSQALMDSKEDMYSYTRNYYLFLMNRKTGKFPNFKIKTR